MLLLIQYTLIFASVLMLVALGGYFLRAQRCHQHCVLRELWLSVHLPVPSMMKYLPDSAPAPVVILSILVVWPVYLWE